MKVLQKPLFLLIVLMIVAACSSTSSTTTAPTATTDSPATTAELATTTAPATTAGVSTTATPTTGEVEAGPQLVVASTDLGGIVTDGDGFTLYVFMPDAQGRPTCVGECEFTWPPLFTEVSAGETNGQGVGGNWFVIGADGEPITG